MTGEKTLFVLYSFKNKKAKKLYLFHLFLPTNHKMCFPLPLISVHHQNVSLLLLKWSRKSGLQPSAGLSGSSYIIVFIFFRNDILFLWQLLHFLSLIIMYSEIRHPDLKLVYGCKRDIKVILSQFQTNYLCKIYHRARDCSFWFWNK